MKYFLLILPAIVIFSCNQYNKPVTIESPSGNLKVLVTPGEEKDLFYQVNQISGSNEIPVIDPSPIGLKTSKADFTNYLEIRNISDVYPISETYSMISGKKKELSYSANEVTISVTNKANKELKIVFRVFDEGVAFRYILPGKPDEEDTVKAELTGFKVPENINAWMSPYQSPKPWGDPAYEANYLAVRSGSPSPEKVGWAFPLLFHTGENWIYISESGLDAGYCATHLKQDCTGGLYTIAFPEPEERMGDGSIYPSSTLPWEMPWRFILISNTIDEIVESSMVYHLAKPCKLKDTSWIIPGRASWSWWSSRGGRTVKNLKRFVDLSAEMNWEYSLVDAGWGRMPDGTIQDVISYADSLNIGLLLWYPSGGRRDSTRSNEDFVLFNDDTREEEMKKLKEWGIKGIKVDFFSTDKQLAIELYEKIMKDAARFHLLVNFHGCTLPRGWTRTYPNLLTMEAVRGAECYRYAENYPDLAPSYNTLAGILRTTAGPADYTPATFSNNRYPHKTTRAHELALTVVYESGIIHMADTPESYLSQPQEVIEFIKKIPAAWDETRLLEAIPGELLVIARRKGNRWFVAGINGKNENQTINFSMPESLSNVTFIGDHESGSGFIITQIDNIEDSFRVDFMPNGGFVMY